MEIRGNERGWLLRGSEGNRSWHFQDERMDTVKGLCGLKLCGQPLARESVARWPYCQRCRRWLKNEERRVALEIVSYFFAKGKSWADYEMDEFEQLRDRHLWLTQAIAAADPHYQPADYGRWIRERQARDAK